MLGQTCTATARAFPKFCLSTEGPSRSTEALIALQHETLANRLGYVKSLAEVLPLSEACVVRFEGWMRDLLAVSQNGKEFLPVLNQYNTCTGAKKKKLSKQTLRSTPRSQTSAASPVGDFRIIFCFHLRSADHFHPVGVDGPPTASK